MDTWYVVFHWNDGVESYPASLSPVGPAATMEEAFKRAAEVLERQKPAPHYTYHLKYAYTIGKRGAS